jgi:amino acid adenylation domain-containing protein
VVRFVHEALRASAAHRPNAVALVCDGRRLTYAELDAKADSTASALARSGVVRGDRVAICLPNCSAAVVAAFGASRAGATFVIIDGASSDDTVRRIVNDCQPAVLIVAKRHVETASKLLGTLSPLRWVAITGPIESGDTPVVSFDSILESAQPPAALADGDPLDLAYLIYTSGTSGVPKGVMINHRSSLFAIQIDSDFLGLTSQDVILSTLPLAFGYGFHQVLKSVRVGATLVLEKSFVFPAEILQRMSAERVTGFPGLPTMFSLLLRQNLGAYDLTSLRYLSSMGAPLAPGTIAALRRAFPDARLFSMYSLTEACNALGLDPEEIDRHPDSVGRPLPGTEAWIVDDEGRPLGPGEVGELVIAGDHVRSGYWNDDVQTAGRFRRGRHPRETVCYTGDLFRFDDKGLFYFMGRKDEMIKTSGRKVWPRQIEEVLLGIPGVVEAAVVAAPDAMWGHVIYAFAVVDDAARASLTPTDILRHCSRHLESFMVPKRLQLVDGLPRTSSGKIKKSELAGQIA